MTLRDAPQTDSAAASEASSAVDVGDIEDAEPPLRRAQGLTPHLLRQACHPAEGHCSPTLFTSSHTSHAF